jgi:hypothetical protein
MTRSVSTGRRPKEQKRRINRYIFAKKFYSQKRCMSTALKTVCFLRGGFIRGLALRGKTPLRGAPKESTSDAHYH